MPRFLSVLACLVVLANAAPLEKTLHFSAQSENAVVETAGASGDPVKTHVSTHSLILDHGSARKKIEVRITKDFVKKLMPVIVPISTTPLPGHVTDQPHVLPAHHHEHVTAAPPHIHAHERIAAVNPPPAATAAPVHAHNHVTAAPVHHMGHIHVVPAHPHERAAAAPAHANVVAVHPHENARGPHIQEPVTAPSAHPHGHVPPAPIHAFEQVIAAATHAHAHTTAAPLHPIVLHGESPVVINNATLSSVLHRILTGDIKTAHLSGKEVVKDLAGKHVAIVLSASMHVVDLGSLKSPGNSHVAIAHLGHNDSSVLASVLKHLAALAHLKGHAISGAKHPASCVAKISHVLPGIVILSTPKPDIAATHAPPKIVPEKAQLPAPDQTSSVPPPAEVQPTTVDSY